MNDKEHRDLKAALREDQLESIDEDALSALMGDYDNSELNEIEVISNAEEDEEELEFIPTESDELAKNIAEECQGLNENGLPNSSTAILLDVINPYIEAKRTLAKSVVTSPELSIHTRDSFIEFCYDFKTQSSPELKTMWNAVEKYGQLSDEITEDTEEWPHLLFVVVPMSAYGVYYMSAECPISWSLQAARPGEDACVIKLLFETENISFYESDDLDMDDVVGDVLRELEDDVKYQEQVLAQQLREQEEAAKREDAIENSRRFL